MIRFVCPNCSETVGVNDWFAGQVVKCLSCGFESMAPALTLPPIIAAAQLAVAMGDGPIAYATPTLTPKLAPFTIASLICGILAIGGLPLGSGLLFAPLAIIFSGIAGRARERNPGIYAGQGLAAAGGVLGWLSVIVMVSGLICYLALKYNIV
jgi:hypothetical protein